MFWFVFVLFVVGLSAFFIQYRKQMANQNKYLMHRRKIEELSTDEALEQSKNIILTWTKESNPIGFVLEIEDQFGPVTKKFLREFAALISPNGAHRLGVRFAGISRYDSTVIKIGTTDYLDICVQRGFDKVIVIDGSEVAISDNDVDSYPTIYHLLVDYGY